MEQTKAPIKKRWYQKIKIDHYLVLSVVAIILYDVASFIMYALTGTEAPTLTVAVHGFFGTEIAACAFIKKFKIGGQ